MHTEIRKMAKSKALDRQTLVSIYEHYSPMLFRYGYRLLGDQDAAEECVSETFSRFLNSLKGNPAGPENIKAYLYRIAHNWITDYFRNLPPMTIQIDDDFQESIPDQTNGNPAVLMRDNLELKRIREALNQLPKEQQQVIALRFFEGQKHEEVAYNLGKSVEATRALQYRALISLRQILLAPEEV